MLPVDSDRLTERELSTARENFLAAKPFQHIVIDGLFDPEVLRRVVADFAAVQHNTSYSDPTTRLKFTCDDWALFPPATFHFISYLNSGSFISVLEQMTAMTGLTSDPFLLGGGLHETKPGGFLKMHTDFNFHQRLNLDRRLNAIIFLNEGWEPGWGGELVLSEPDMGNQIKVAPLFNRIVLFNTNDFSFHGHPDPHTFPAGNSRKSVAMYYYANGRPAHETTSAKVGTTYKARAPGDLPIKERLKEAGRLLFGLKGPR